MTILLVRHARAGERESWVGDDRLRPLDERGRDQAAALVQALAPYPIDRILSSPYARCVQTVEPLVRARGLGVEEREELGEERQDPDGVRLIRELALADVDVAVCVHGGLGEALVGRGQRKGETLVLERGTEGLRVLDVIH